MNNSNLLKGQQKCTFRFQFPFHETMKSDVNSKTEGRNSMRHAELPLFSVSLPAGVSEEPKPCIIDIVPFSFNSNAAQDSRCSSYELNRDCVLDEKENDLPRMRLKTKRPRKHTECKTVWANAGKQVASIDFRKNSEDVQRQLTHAGMNARGSFESTQTKEKTAGLPTKQVRFSA